MPPLDAALARLGRAVLGLLHPGLARRAAGIVDDDEEKRVAEEVDRLADLLGSR